MEHLITGDCLTELARLPDNSVHCCITSPPYWGLRDYGNEEQLGLEATPSEYVSRMVDVFRHVRHVLRFDGTLWLNLGDCYAHAANAGKGVRNTRRGTHGVAGPARKGSKDLKPKDLVGIPWRVALALQADGWYLRQDIIWHKPNPMPESVTDRCTKSHEYIFMLSKSSRYHFDAEAIKEPSRYPNDDRKSRSSQGNKRVPTTLVARMRPGSRTYPFRNRRSVWTITTKPYRGAHFATFPSDLIEPCILAGCPRTGVVLDPFLGSGTTASVAKALGRGYIGIELNPSYMVLARQRIAKVERIS